jgi:hypothetical protein
MRLVYDDVVPFNFFKGVEAYPHSFKAGHDNIEFTFLHYVGEDVFPFIASGDQLDNLSAGHPFLKLVHPVSKSDLGGDHDMGSTHFLKLLDESQDGDGLDSFS